MKYLNNVFSIQAIGSRNLLKSVAKQREAQQQQLHALIAEKRMQLERLVEQGIRFNGVNQPFDDKNKQQRPSQ